jgi:hypothetical protein
MTFPDIDKHYGQSNHGKNNACGIGEQYEFDVDLVGQYDNKRHLGELIDYNDEYHQYRIDLLNGAQLFVDIDEHGCMSNIILPTQNNEYMLHNLITKYIMNLSKCWITICHDKNNYYKCFKNINVQILQKNIKFELLD